MCLVLDKVSIRRGTEPLFSPINLQVDSGSIHTLMGPSGCGKSTLLSFIAGTLSDTFTTRGDVRLGQQSLLSAPLEKRQVGILFQDPLLFPHMTILENLMFAAASGKNREKRLTAQQTLKEIGLAGCASYYPLQLSGGQAARVSLMRTLAAEPKALLLDEPFSKLDRDTRSQFRAQVYDTISRRGIPAILVTHDEDDIAETSRVLRMQDRTQSESC